MTLAGKFLPGPDACDLLGEWAGPGVCVRLTLKLTSSNQPCSREVMGMTVTSRRTEGMGMAIFLAVSVSTSPCLGEELQTSLPRYTPTHYFLMGLSVLLFASLAGGAVVLLREEMLRKRRSLCPERRMVINVQPRAEGLPSALTNGRIVLDDVSRGLEALATSSPVELEASDRRGSFLLRVRDK